MRMLKRIGVGLVAFVALVLIAGLVWEPLTATTSAGPPLHRYDARIVRDEWGVPHLFGRTDPDVAYALAYAHAEDDFATLQEVAAMTRGRAAALLGSEGAKIDYAAAVFDARATTERLYPTVPADTRALLDGYAAGLNLYAARHPAEVKLARLFPLDGRDIAVGFVVRLPFFFGIDDPLGALVGNQPLPPERAALTGTSENGSNAFAVAPRRSGDGHTRLLSNAHQPWTGGTAWYEVTVHSGTGWNFAGATFPGSPYPFLGHNRNLGWTNTVSRPDLTDIYKLVLNEDGTRYRFDGKWLALEAHRVWLRVKVGPFALPVPRTVYRSVHGPVIVNTAGAFALHYAGMGTIGAIDQWYRLTKARDWTEWSSQMSRDQIPAFNFIYADRTGRIAHIYNAQFPLRKPGFDYGGVLVGDTSRNLASGTAPWPQVPQHVDPPSGFLANSNNTPFWAAGAGSELDPRAYSPLLGIERDMTNRAQRAVELMSATPAIGEDELLRIKFDTGYDKTGYAGRWLDAVRRLDVSGQPRLIEAQKLLNEWDWTLDGKGPGDALACLMLRPANRWNYKRLGTMPDVRAELIKWSDHLATHFGRLDPPLGALLRVRRGSVDLPMDGGPDVLRAAALWDLDPDGRARVRHGDSFVMLIDWDPTGHVVSRSVQPFGAATTRPQSPHYADQARIFVEHRLKPVHFESADILAHAVRMYRP